ncbi:Nonsense-mediated mRNA decay protein 5 [Marasmius crinis-equi]|uniref:Nonsense-mediated mRNA decay protein 5 n=1 Tax=Marasmius crinis-equi TaxID=585013 RepID=A0ABR3EPC9_9AGAR
MDLQSLANLFSMTFNPDPNIRKAAELDIRKVSDEEGMLAALLEVIAGDFVDLATRQACSVWVKNRVSSHYLFGTVTGRALIHQSDKSALRSNIIPLIAGSPSHAISLQLASTLKSIISADFPDEWPALLEDIKGLLKSPEIRQVHAGCIVALQAGRAFRFRRENDYIAKFVESLFPTLMLIAERMIGTPPSQAQEIPTMLHLILKTYESSLAIDSYHQLSAESLISWGQLLLALVNLDIPEEAVPEDEDERERSEWWKVKKWTFATLGRLFHKFGKQAQFPMQKEYGHFAEHFVTTFVPRIFNIYLRQVELYVSGQTWLSKKCRYHIFSFFTGCVKPQSTWVLLKPHVETLVSSFVFSHLCFTQSKQTLWQDDPVDYLRVAVNEYESYSSPATAATNFLCALARFRTKTAFIIIFRFIDSVLRSGSTPPPRFGALYMTAVLGPWIMRHPDARNNMEEFVEQFVAPEYTSSEPYMRAIACEVLGAVVKSGIEWTNEENLDKNFRAVAAALDDPELPVRVQAILALTELIVSEESAILRLSDETDLDILNQSMEVMIDRFTPELLPVVAQLTESLCCSYMRLAKESISQEVGQSGGDFEARPVEGDVDKTYAAMGVSKTIWEIVITVENAPQILTQVQEIIIPLVVFTLENKLLGEQSHSDRRISTYTCIAPNRSLPQHVRSYILFDVQASYYFSQHVACIRGHLQANQVGWGRIFGRYEAIYLFEVEYAENLRAEMLAPLDNLISYGHEVIRNRPDYKQMLVDIFTTSLTIKTPGENDGVNGCKLAESILLNLRGYVDDTLQIFIATALDHLELAETAGLKLALLNVLINAVLYNPSAALRLIETSKPGSARTFFDKWFAAINLNYTLLPRVHDKKLSILALSSLLELGLAPIPESLREGWPGIVGGILRLFKDLPKAIAERKALEESLQDDFYAGPDIGGEKLLNLDDDDEDIWDKDSAYLEILTKEEARRSKEFEDEGESIESDVEGKAVAEELGYISPLDNVNLYNSFKQALTAFRVHNGTDYQASTTSLDIEHQGLLMEVMRLADAPVVATSSQS